MNTMETDIEHWITIGMSKYHTPGFQDTSRLMTSGFPGASIYVEPPAEQSPRIELAWRTEADEHVTVLHPPASMHRKFDPLRLTLRLQTRRLEEFISGHYGDNWRENTAIYVTNWSYYQQPLVRLLRPKYLVFDVVDDVLAFPYSVNAHRVLQFWRWFASQASVTIAVSPVLKELTHRQLGIDPTILPNAVDAGHFMRSHENLRNFNEFTAGVKVGFAGTLNHWIDYSAMYALLENYPQMHLYISGREGNFGCEAIRQAFLTLKSHPRAHFLGPLEYECLPEFLHSMDVLLLPRVPSPSSESSSPLKLFEYLAVGKPIVSLGVPLLSEVEDLVYHSATMDGLFHAMNAAISEENNASLTRLRQSYASEHTWSQRVREALSLIH